MKCIMGDKRLVYISSYCNSLGDVSTNPFAQRSYQAISSGIFIFPKFSLYLIFMPAMKAERHADINKEQA
jgi:hypothetical protein